MPVTVTVEDGTGVASANAFQSVDAVTARLAAYLYGSAWAATVDVDRRAQCVIEATSQLSRLGWRGTRSTAEQPLAWPRTSVVDPDGFTIEHNVMPEWLLDAHARQALFLYTQTTSPYADVGLEPGTPIQIGPIRVTPADRPTTIAPDVRAVVAPYLSGGSGVVELVRC